MKCHRLDLSRQRKRVSGLTLIEFLVAVVAGSIALVVVGILSAYGTRSFAAIGNYTDLDQMNRQGAEILTREIRQAVGVIEAQTDLPARWLTLTNADQANLVKFTWDSSARTVVFKRTGYAAQTILTGCDSWDFSLYQRTPIPTATNILFHPVYPATDLSAAKLINLSWKCSRAILGHKLNTDSVQTVQVALRNQR
jgi:hypothetical protein